MAKPLNTTGSPRFPSKSARMVYITYARGLKAAITWSQFGASVSGSRIPESSKSGPLKNCTIGERAVSHP